MLRSTPRRFSPIIAFLILFSFSSLGAAQSRSLYMPVLQSMMQAESNLTLINSSLEPAVVTLTARSYKGSLLQGSDIINPVSLTLAGSSSRSFTAYELFGRGVTSGWVELKTNLPAISGTLLFSDSKHTSIEGAAMSFSPAKKLIFPKATADASSANQLVLVNTAGQPIDQINISFFENSGRLAAQSKISLPGFGGFVGGIADLVSSLRSFDGYAVVEANSANAMLIGLETYWDNFDVAVLQAVPAADRLPNGYLPQFGDSAGNSSTVVLVNYGSESQSVGLTAAIAGVENTGEKASFKTVLKTLAPNERVEERVDQLFGFKPEQSILNHINFQSQGLNGRGFFAYLETEGADGGLSAVPAQESGYSDITFPIFPNGTNFYTGLTLVNAGSNISSITIDVTDLQGDPSDTVTLSLAPNERWSGFLSELFPESQYQTGGRVHITASSLILAVEILGSTYSGALAAIPPQGVALTAQPSGAPVSVLTGGVVLSEDGSASLAIPPHALDKDTDVRITPLSSSNFPKQHKNERLLGAVEGTPDGTHFRIPVRLRFSLSEALEPGTAMDVLIFSPSTGQYESSEFVAIVEPSGRVASADVTHFTQFAVAADRTNLRLSSLNPSSAPVGAIITVSGTGFSTTPDLNRVLFPSATSGFVTAPGVTSSSTGLTAQVPAGAVSGKVYVQVGSVRSNWLRFRVTASTNQAPVVNSGPSQTITLPAGAVLSGTATDDGLPNGTLSTTWTAFSGPGAVTFGDSAALSTPASFAMAGTYTLRLSANDSALTSTDDVIVTVNPSAPVNQAPVVSAGANQTITLPAGATLAGTVTDDGLPTGSGLTVSWSKVSGPGIVTFTTSTAPSTKAAFSAAGTYILQLTATDSLLTNSSDVTIVVIAANTAPVVNAGADQTITLPAKANLTGSATDDGLPSGSTLSVSWSKVSGAGTVTFGSTSSLSTTATFSTSGTYGLRLTATDSELTSSRDVTIVVKAPVNLAPVVNAGADQTITLPASANLAGSATDDGLPAGSILSVSWSKVSGPGTVTFSNANALSTTATFSTSGTYTLRLTGSDSLLSTGDDVIITANPAVTSTRDPLKQPFSSTSIWNMPIGAAAIYVPANIPLAYGYKVSKMDEERIVLRPSAPLVNIYYNGVGWSGGNRCTVQGNLLTRVPMPTDFVVPSDYENESTSALSADGRTVIQMQPLARCSSGGDATSLVVWGGVDLYGTGIPGAHGGSNLSAIGGSIRVGELRPGQAGPNHALKVVVDAAKSLFKCTSFSACYRWPASTADGYAVGYYGTQNPGQSSAVKMGALLALPASLDVYSLSLETEPARELAFTLQNYGAYIVDDTYGDGFGFATEYGPDGRFRDQFRSDYGYDFVANLGDNTPWARDMEKLIKHLNVIDNNSSSSIGGGGMPRQTLALPLQ
jgi:PKD repeat protein